MLYPVVIVTAGFAEGFVRGRPVIDGNPAATANNLLVSELLYHAGGVGDIIDVVCNTVLALLFYELLKPVSKGLALLAAFFRLMHVAILAVSTLYHFAALISARAARDATGFEAAQLSWCLSL